MGTFDDIKVGDIVVVRDGRGNCSRRTVERVTSTLFIIGATRFRKLDGREPGTSAYWYSQAMAPTDQNIERAIQSEAETAIARMLSKIGRAKYTNPVALAEGLRALMVHVEGGE